jgi:hypothetical protein
MSSPLDTAVWYEDASAGVKSTSAKAERSFARSSLLSSQLSVLFLDVYFVHSQSVGPNRLFILPSPDIESMIDGFQFRYQTCTPTTPSRGHAVNKNNFLDTGMDEGHGAHGTRLVSDVEGPIGELVALSILYGVLCGCYWLMYEVRRTLERTP